MAVSAAVEAVVQGESGIAGNPGHIDRTTERVPWFMAPFFFNRTTRPIPWFPSTALCPAIQAAAGAHAASS